jgi:SAM-dependent methyltransferase
MTRSAYFYDAIYEASKDFAAEASRLHELIQEQQLSKAASLLDVACGTGQHLAHLRRYYEVQGIDLDHDMLAVARVRLPNVPLHQGDMRHFDLNRRFDVVICLFSAIGYVRSPRGLRQAVQSLVHHLEPGGMLLVEPWITPEEFRQGIPHAVFFDKRDLKIARMDVSQVRGRLSVLDFHYLAATPSGVEAFRERHTLGLFTVEEYQRAFESAGLVVTHNPRGLTGRGLFIAHRPSSRELTR